MIRLFPYLILPLSLGLITCTKDLNPEKKSATRKILVHGDPLSLIAGAKLNKTSFLNTENYRDFNNFKLNRISVFEERSANRNRSLGQKLPKFISEREEFGKKNIAPSENLTLINREKYHFSYRPIRFHQIH